MGVSSTVPAPRSSCPVAGSLDVLGDRWTLLVLRDILIGGVRHFADFAADEGIAPNTLTDRLQRLAAAGLVQRVKDESDGRRWSYVPCESAIALLPVLIDLMVWGTAHTTGSAPDWLLVAVAEDRAGLIERLADAARG